MTLTLNPSSLNSADLSPRRLQASLLMRRMIGLARIDPNPFIEFCFTDPGGRQLRQGLVHRELQAFLSDHRKSLIELPRDHGKSMQVCSRILWELGRDSSLRVKVVCSSEGIAAERGHFMREAITGNSRLKLVFPQLLPAEPWSATRFSIQRPANVIGPSVTAIGVGATLTGTRADLLVCDDIVDVRSLASRAERTRIKAYFRDNLMNLLEPDGRCWNLFTPWHGDDLNNELKRNEAFAHFRRAVGNDLEPVWPERWTRERLEERHNEIGAASFARGYRLLPLSEEETPIRAEWVQFWATEMPLKRTILSVDPAVSTKQKADASALVVLGLKETKKEGDARATKEVHCLAAIARRVRTPDLVQLISDVDRHWHPDVILFESNAAFAGIKDLLVRQASFGSRILGISQTREKIARVESFSVSVANGSFKLKGTAAGGVDPGQLDLFEEMTTYPAAEHDDLVDAAATGTEYLLATREPKIHMM